MPELDKENRPPRAMALAEKRTPKGSTPGRPKKRETQFFEVGKVGRKTGITLVDKGIRDEHGMEPVEHVFSSPVSPQRQGDVTALGSDMQESSGPNVDMTLTSRKTPRLPPPRATPLKHTNIGSPKRGSTGSRIAAPITVELEANGSPTRPKTLPPANRKIDFAANTVRTSIESPSPFKPRHVLPRSPKQDRQDPFAVETKGTSPLRSFADINGDAEAGADVQPIDDAPLMFDDDDDYQVRISEEPRAEANETAADTHQSPTKKRSRSSRKSGDLVNTSQVARASPSVNRSSKKRDRSILENDHTDVEANRSQSQISASEPAQKKPRSRLSNSKIIVHQDDDDSAIDPSLVEIGHEDHSVADDVRDNTSEPRNAGKGKGKGKKTKASVPRERDPNQRSPSKLRKAGESIRASIGTGLFSLRATTPYEDSGERTSRSGRNLIAPLKYWQNETRVYRNGETERIVRADEIKSPKKKNPKRRGGNYAQRIAKLEKRINKMGDIEEESDTESIHPDEWEETMGVIQGNVAKWDPEQQAGNAEELVPEDLAFASSSIVTRDVANSEFKYAKIMTLPFFGAGVVELPPEGFKRAKNSRKMQMVFFVHEGKVMAEVGAANGGETNQFAISKGGVWVVPRGNNYAITNESRTRTARIFFAQGCEVEAASREDES